MTTIADLLALFSTEPKAAQEATIAALPALLAAAPDALRGGVGAELVEKIIDESRADGRGADALEIILDRGAASPALASVVALWCHDDDQRLRLVKKALALGADPGAGPSGKTALAVAAAASPIAVVEALAAAASDEARLDALGAALRAIHENAPRNAEMLLDALADVDRPGADGLSALHVTALHGSPALLERALARSADLSRPITVPHRFACKDCLPESGGFEVHLVMPAGSTALDLVEQARGIYVTLDRAYGSKGTFAAGRARRIPQLEGCLALLRARGARHGEPRREGLPPWTAEIDDLIAALGRGAGLEAGRAERASAAVDTTGIGPWTYFSRAIDILGDELARSALATAAKSTWLGCVLLGEHRAAKRPKAKGLPAEAQRLLKNGAILGQRGEAHLLLWTPQPGKAQFVALSAGGVEVLADDVASFLRRELLALGVDTSRAAVTEAGQMHGPTDAPSFQPRILRSRFDAPPASSAIDRAGGLPIGVTAATWPRREGKPMHHVLTLDLKQHPTLAVEGKRALALFVSSPQAHEAFEPGNDHVAVLLLDEAQLAAGEPEWPADLEGPRLASGTLRFEDEGTLSKRERLARSHAAFLPTWLQPDHDADIWAASPGQFVLQLTAELVPGVSLGDLGIMYVFSKTAFFQCH